MKVDFEKLKKRIDPRPELIKRLKKLMDEKDWTQGRVAEAMHISRITVNRWFNQEQLPNTKDKGMIFEILEKFKG